MRKSDAPPLCLANILTRGRVFARFIGAGGRSFAVHLVLHTMARNMSLARNVLSRLLQRRCLKGKALRAGSSSLAEVLRLGQWEYRVGLTRNALRDKQPQQQGGLPWPLA